MVHVGNVSFYAARALFCLNANAAAGKWCNIRVNPAAPRALASAAHFPGDARRHKCMAASRVDTEKCCAAADIPLYLISRGAAPRICIASCGF